MTSFDSEESKAMSDSGGSSEPDLLLSGEWNYALWRRLAINFKDRFAPEKLPPLELTSRPVDVGMLEGDRLSLPWFRTIFTNVGDVITPESLPPLELESRPVDVGELIADQMSHPWWTSLLRNLADQVAPERMPPLQLTSKPMDPGLGTGPMLLPRWSSTINTPKVFLPDKAKPDYVPPVVLLPAPKPKPTPAEDEFTKVLTFEVKRDLRRSIFRQRVWISLAAIEVLTLIATSIWWK